MKYSIDTNALIAITKSDDITRHLINYIAEKEDVSFFVTHYVAKEFESFFENKDNLNENETRQFDNYRRLSESVTGIIIDDTEFFTLDRSMLDGSHVLASGVSGFAEIDISKQAHQKSGSRRSYEKWRKSKLNDRLIKEMSEANSCDAIITANKGHFAKVPSTYPIMIVEISELLI